MPECEECGRVFSTWEELGQHMRAMHAYFRTRETL